ncbi:uncharacterized protein VTP21DRAFT_8681 [Calcarisporiella thermophila]|uniref:uncharacterized protein n=1 Tax=Calcarisporiella thermophila TaxID=911321 RepID=UPI00374448B2
MQSPMQTSERFPEGGLICPICEESMVSLHQLNQHLEDVHPEEGPKKDIMNWFRNAQKKVFNPITKAASNRLSNIPNLVNELNRTLDLGGSSPFADGTNGNLTENAAAEIVTREHWQKEGQNDVCNSCGKLLNIYTGKQHCRKCGKIFCDSHCQLSMRLSAAAQHDPNGFWCRVCEQCFKSRDGYSQTGGVYRSWTRDFIRMRKKTIDRVHLEHNRIEKRLEKLANIYASNKTSLPGTLSPVPGKKLSLSNRIRELEMSVVKWESDSDVLNCPFCNATFNKFTKRKHHCRLCGRIICDECSDTVPLLLNLATDSILDAVGDIRACVQCRGIILKRREEKILKSRQPPVVKLYQELQEYRKTIDNELPKFQEMLSMLQKDSAISHDHQDFHAAAATRKKLLENFNSFDAASKRLLVIPARTTYQKRLHENIHLASNQYLQQKMFPLAMLPKILKPSQTSTSGANHISSNSNHRGGDQISSTSSSNGGSTGTQQLSLSADDLAREEQLAVIREQRKLVEGFLRDASQKRKFDDVKTLKRSLDELDAEIERLERSA